MRAEVRSIHSPDAPDALDRWRPSSPRDFELLLEAEIGPAGGEGSEVFTLRAVGPDWLAAHDGDKGFRWGRGLLVLQEWDFAVAERAISDLCRRTEGEAWADVAIKLARFMHWEFEDYRPAPV
ncbi:MAG: Imm8 family immunity protein [Chloroflexota bacterium]